jgi:pyrimidine-specific ribonucleoside hydrolase
MNGITDRPGYPGRSVRTTGPAFRSMRATRGLRIAAATLVAASLSAGCDAKSTRATISLPVVPAGVNGVVVDTDMGLDDALALLYLGSRNDVAIRAVTVVGDGLVHYRAGVRHVRELLTLTGQPDVPVACGGERPLQGRNAFPDEWRSTADDLYGLELPAPVGRGTDLSATELLAAALDGTTDLLTLGPYTNVAAALREDPELATRVPAVVSMAGAVDVPGNAPGGVAEYNVWVDPLAAKEVLAAVPVTLVPLDATNAVPITSFFVDVLGRHLGTPAAEAVHDLIADDPFLVSGQYFFWDPLAAGIADRAEARDLCRPHAPGHGVA